MVVAPVVVVVMVVVVEYCTPEVPQKVRSSKYDVSKVLYVRYVSSKSESGGALGASCIISSTWGRSLVDHF